MPKMPAGLGELPSRGIVLSPSRSFPLCELATTAPSAVLHRPDPLIGIVRCQSRHRGITNVVRSRRVEPPGRASTYSRSRLQVPLSVTRSQIRNPFRAESLVRLEPVYGWKDADLQVLLCAREDSNLRPAD